MDHTQTRENIDSEGEEETLSFPESCDEVNGATPTKGKSGVLSDCKNAFFNVFTHARACAKSFGERAASHEHRTPGRQKGGILKTGAKRRRHNKRVTLLDPEDEEQQVNLDRHKGAKAFSLPGLYERALGICVNFALLASAFMLPFRFVALCEPISVDYLIESVLLVETVTDLMKDEAHAKTVGLRRLFFSVMGWLPIIIGASTLHCDSYLALTVLQLPRLFRGISVLRNRERDLTANIKVTACIQVAAIILGMGHLLGCLSYSIVRAQGFPLSTNAPTWLAQFNERAFGDESLRGSPMKRYIVALYKGLSQMATLNYVERRPARISDTLLSMVSAVISMFIVGIVLGRLFNFVLYRDERLEAHRQRLEALTDYSKERGVPASSLKSVSRHLLFQYEKASDMRRTEDIYEQLPPTLARRVARNGVDIFIFRKNMGIFRGCSDRLLDEISSMLREMHYMPAEIVRKAGSLPSEVIFLVSGQLEEIDDRGEIVREVLAQGDPNPRCCAQEFFLGMKQQFTIRTKATSDATVYTLGLEEYTDLSSKFLRDNRKLRENILNAFELNEDGTSSAREAAAEEDAWTEKQKENMKQTLNETYAKLLDSGLNSALLGNQGHLADTLNAGLPVDAFDTDGRCVGTDFQ